MFGDMHDCAYLIACSEAAPERRDWMGRAGELGTYVVNTEKAPWEVHRIASGAEEIRSLFAHPGDAPKCPSSFELSRIATESVRSSAPT